METPTPLGSNASAEERFEIFHESYGNDFDAAYSLAGVVTAAGDFLERIIGADAVSAGMARMVHPLLEGSGVRLNDDREWREALEEAALDCFTYWKLGNEFHDLAAYALYGIVFPEGDADPAETVEKAVDGANAFFATLPAEQWSLRETYGALSDIEKLVTMASGRWALDNGRPVSPAALAALGGVSEGRIRNMMSGARKVFHAKDGLIPAPAALDWLKERPEFYTSIWREVDAVPSMVAAGEEDVGEPVVFVPVARDGSVFHPGLARGAGYAVGPKGAERQIEDFDAALKALQRMRTPYWRRPNDAGNWGVVRGMRWERLSSTELTVFENNPGYRLPPIAAGDATGEAR